MLCVSRFELLRDLVGSYSVTSLQMAWFTLRLIYLSLLVCVCWFTFLHRWKSVWWLTVAVPKPPRLQILEQRWRHPHWRWLGTAPVKYVQHHHKLTNMIGCVYGRVCVCACVCINLVLVRVLHKHTLLHAVGDDSIPSKSSDMGANHRKHFSYERMQKPAHTSLLKHNNNTKTIYNNKLYIYL